MKKLIPLFVLLVLLESFQCSRDKLYSNILVVRENVVLSDTSVRIPFGQSLRFDLTLPDSLDARQVRDSSLVRLPLNSVERCGYNFYFYEVDTNGRTRRVTDAGAITATVGQLDPYGYTIYTTTSRPYRSVLSFAPPRRGLYYVSFYNGSNFISVNHNRNGGEVDLHVNIAARNKHWELFEPYYPGFSRWADSVDHAGYGSYLFKVE